MDRESPGREARRLDATHGGEARRPDCARRLPAELEMSETRGWRSWVSTTDHKRIGQLYFYTAFAFFLIGGLEALLIPLQVAKPQNSFLSAETYNPPVTMHRTPMIFPSLLPP